MFMTNLAWWFVNVREIALLTFWLWFHFQGSIYAHSWNLSADDQVCTLQTWCVRDWIIPTILYNLVPTTILARPPGAYCIKLLPEKNSGYFNPNFFSYGKVNGKILLTKVFQKYSPAKVLCSRPQMCTLQTWCVRDWIISTSLTLSPPQFWHDHLRAIA